MTFQVSAEKIMVIQNEAFRTHLEGIQTKLQPAKPYFSPPNLPAALAQLLHRSDVCLWWN